MDNRKSAVSQEMHIAPIVKASLGSIAVLLDRLCSFSWAAPLATSGHSSPDRHTTGADDMQPRRRVEHVKPVYYNNGLDHQRNTRKKTANALLDHSFSAGGGG